MAANHERAVLSRSAVPNRIALLLILQMLLWMILLSLVRDSTTNGMDGASCFAVLATISSNLAVSTEFNSCRDAGSV
jgi:hypothetical protein